MSVSSVFICGEKRLFESYPLDMVHKFFVAFIPIFVAIDAIGLVAMFLGLAGDTPREQRQREGFIAIFTAFCISIGFIFLGKIIFTALGITVADFQVAGGLILLGIAGRELLNVAPASREATDDFGVVPLGMPLIAGPALLTALLILVDTVGLLYTIAALLVNLALVVVAFWNADFVAHLMGRQGLRGVSKIVALLLAAIAVSLIRRGWLGV
jgi:multiple antibiotic resistance protein